MCTFPNGSSCEILSLYSGKCKPTPIKTITPISTPPQYPAKYIVGDIMWRKVDKNTGWIVLSVDKKNNEYTIQRVDLIAGTWYYNSKYPEITTVWASKADTAYVVKRVNVNPGSLTWK